MSDDSRTVGDLSDRRVWVTSSVSRGRSSPVHLSRDCRAFSRAASPLKKPTRTLADHRPVCRYCDGVADEPAPNDTEPYRTLRDAKPSDFP